MKKHSLLIVIGGFLLIVGILLTFNKKKDIIYYNDEDKMTNEEVTSLIVDKTKSVIDIYENQKDRFMLDREIDEDSDYYMILNYDVIINQLYTEKGKEELEKIKFNNKPFVYKENEEVYILKTIPDDNMYSKCSISISNISYDKNIISATISFTKNDVDSDDTLTYHVYEKNIELVKKEDKWLINTFIYSNV